MKDLDPRDFQIAFLSSLLVAGLYFRGFAIAPAQIAATFAGGLLAQAFFLWIYRLEGTGYKSAVITCLSLSLLLRSEGILVPFSISAAAMSSKFLLRVNGKHLFNPGNFGVVLGLLTGWGWVSPAQWGHDLIWAAWFVLLGATVVWRAGRQDVSWAFLGFYLGLVLLRVLYLGQRSAVFWHQFESGALLLFTFFMISDPKTIPDSGRGRLILAGTVALFALSRQYIFYRTNGLFYALFLLTPTTALWDRLWPRGRHAWRPVSCGRGEKNSALAGARA